MPRPKVTRSLNGRARKALPTNGSTSSKSPGPEAPLASKVVSIHTWWVAMDTSAVFRPARVAGLYHWLVASSLSTAEPA